LKERYRKGYRYGKARKRTLAAIGGYCELREEALNRKCREIDLEDTMQLS
jgi:hypothetical protein